MEEGWFPRFIDCYAKDIFYTIDVVTGWWIRQDENRRIDPTDMLLAEIPRPTPKPPAPPRDSRRGDRRRSRSRSRRDRSRRQHVNNEDLYEDDSRHRAAVQLQYSHVPQYPAQHVPLHHQPQTMPQPIQYVQQHPVSGGYQQAHIIPGQPMYQQAPAGYTMTQQQQQQQVKKGEIAFLKLLIESYFLVFQLFSLRLIPIYCGFQVSLVLSVVLCFRSAVCSILTRTRTSFKDSESREMSETCVCFFKYFVWSSQRVSLCIFSYFHHADR
jgi:hypothetical protein